MSAPGTTTKTGDDNCPCCGHEIDRATAAGKAPVPIPGCVSVCAYCANVLTFAADMALVELSVKEFFNLKPDIQRRLYLLQQGIQNDPLFNPKQK